ncbi:MAG: DEAD/DEAH box helicase [Treponema sp.]|jgi:ATP-dependent RNA helicase RhlB|nr:DEAD/DEAH box helicase [Treponema sp.]
MEFKEFNLHPDLQRGIAEAEYVTCMPVQEQVLTHAFGGQDLYVQSQTGTGKTAAFLTVVFQRLLAEDLLAGKKALIMAPTRELAVQIEEEAKMLGKYLPLKVGSFYGGVGYTQQEKLLRENVQIMVGTPGRVLDLNKSGRMNLMDIAFLILDEADRMFDMGFYPDLRKLIKVVPPAGRRQTMLFSATLNAWVKNLAWEYTHAPFEIEIEPETVTVEEIDQILYHVPSEEKMKLLLGIFERELPESAIIFCNTKRYTEIIAKRLRLNGYDCEFIIGDLPQARRLKVINDVKAGKTKILVATDVAARGLDIEGLAMVVNYDLPTEAENYVHRIGRTARAGKTGRAVTLASEQDVYELPAIERYIGKKIPSEIAAPELHAADKSAGQQIHTEFYEDRGEKRHPHIGGAKVGRPESRRPGSRRTESRRPESRNEGKSRRPEGRPHPHGKAGGKLQEGHRQVPRQGRAFTGDAVHNGASGENRRQSQPHGNERTAAALPETKDLSRMSFEERMALYKQKYHSGAPASSQPADKDNSGGTPAAPRKPEKVSRPKQPKQSAPAQQGIFSRLRGIFRKKK